MTPDEPNSDRSRMKLNNPTLIALLGGVVLLLALIWFFSTNRSSNQDKITANQLTEGKAPQPEKRCSGQAVYDQIKRDLFRLAAERRGSEQAAFDQIAGVAVMRMENVVMESNDLSAATVNCSGSLSLDLPPGVALGNGSHNLRADLDYSVDSAGDVALRNADAIVGPLATVARVAEPAPAETNTVAPEGNAVAVNVQPAPPSAPPTRPSFDCARAETRGETAVCSDGGLAALDQNMSTQYRQALTTASPAQLRLLQATRDRFLAYRDRCPNRQCMADAYVGRMREIRDIMEGRWREPR
jgi:hypothetical protein